MKIIAQNENTSIGRTYAQYGQIPYKAAHIKDRGEERFLLYIGAKKEIASRIKDEDLKNINENIYNIYISSQKDEAKKHSELIKDIFKNSGMRDNDYTQFDTLICVESDNFKHGEEWQRDIEMQEMKLTLDKITHYIEDKQIEEIKERYQSVNDEAIRILKSKDEISNEKDLEKYKEEIYRISPTWAKSILLKELFFQTFLKVSTAFNEIDKGKLTLDNLLKQQEIKNEESHTRKRRR